MSEFSNAGGVLGRSIYDCPDDGPSEDERVEAVLAGVTRQQLQDALVAMLRAARQAEGAALYVESHLYSVVSDPLRMHIEWINEALISDGIERVDEIIGADALEILEADE